MTALQRLQKRGAQTPPQLLQLGDGRQLAWAEMGATVGRPVFYFHGGPGSRLPVVRGQGVAAAAAGVRLICVERPGFGESTRHPQRTLAGWPDDVAALADHLELERCCWPGPGALSWIPLAYR